MVCIEYTASDLCLIITALGASLTAILHGVRLACKHVECLGSKIDFNTPPQSVSNNQPVQPPNEILA